MLVIPVHLGARRWSRPARLFRNPVIYAMELRDLMAAEGINRAELARRLGVSRARVTQWLALLKLSKEELEEIAALGDHWDCRVMTERGMRGWRHRHIDLL